MKVARSRQPAVVMKARREIQRTFIRWLDENRERFTIKPAIVRRTDQFIAMHFDGLRPCLTAILTDEINVHVMLDGQSVDILASFECPLELGSDGCYRCMLCPSGDRRSYEYREDAWIHEVFVPFLDWTNALLAKAEYLELYLHDGSSMARLHSSLPATRPHDQDLRYLRLRWYGTHP